MSDYVVWYIIAVAVLNWGLFAVWTRNTGINLTIKMVLLFFAVAGTIISYSLLSQ